METIKDKELVNKFDDLFPEFEIIPSNEKKQNTLEECIMIIKKSRDTAMSNKVYSTKIPFDPNFSKLKYLEKNDWMAYSLITKEMLDDLKNRGIKYKFKADVYNSIISKWYGESCKDC